MRNLTFIDLFCGCGGFSLGMDRAGFKCLAAIDFNPEAVATFQHNFPGVRHAMRKDLMAYTPEELAQDLGVAHVDVIVGGPPCQGFSVVRQVDGANSGERMVEDPRRHLYKEFLRFVSFFQPKVFVMENVLGIRSAANGEYYARVQQEARALGYRVLPTVEDAFQLGVPQKRRRQLFIGTRGDMPHYFVGNFKPAPRATPKTTLWTAIGDLPPLTAGSGLDEADYDLHRRQHHVRTHGRKYLYKVLEVGRADKLTAHQARAHSDRDLGDFAKLREGENCKEAMDRGVEFDFPYDRENFKDRYTRQHRNEPCSTIVAHMSKDGLMFIHPTQNRSLTPREAARVQSFPDWFVFPVARTHQFRLIGNAVPPLVAEAVGLAVKEYLKVATKPTADIRFRQTSPVPMGTDQALSRLAGLVTAVDQKQLAKLSDEDFKRGWFSVGYLYPGLHPDGALDRGRKISEDVVDGVHLRRVDQRLVAPFYMESGWPLLLEPVVREAERRRERGQLTEHEYYCHEAVIAGMWEWREEIRGPLVEMRYKRNQR
jgi:DNA (cytosine-5)-methyltransferase 1